MPKIVETGQACLFGWVFPRRSFTYVPSKSLGSPSRFLTGTGSSLKVRHVVFLSRFLNRWEKLLCLHFWVLSFRV